MMRIEGEISGHRGKTNDSYCDGVVTLSEIGTIWTINQQAKPLKTLASKLAIVGEFHKI